MIKPYVGSGFILDLSTVLSVAADPVANQYDGLHTLMVVHKNQSHTCIKFVNKSDARDAYKDLVDKLMS